MGEPGAGQCGTGQVRTGEFGTGQVRTRQVNTSQAGEVSTSQNGQVLLGTRVWPYSVQLVLHILWTQKSARRFSLKAKQKTGNR